jgi:hypothetical protein
MPADSAFGRVMHALAQLLDEGDEPIAQTGSAALKRLADTDLTLTANSFALEAHIRAALTGPAAHGAAAAVAEVQPLLAWQHSGMKDGRIPREISLGMGTAQLIGPEGMVVDHSCRVGLFSHAPWVDYTTRSHPAEEFYVMVAGHGWWSQSGQPHQRRGPGERIHHASWEPHQSQARDEPFVALWVWTGDIGLGNYVVEGHTRPAATGNGDGDE